LLGWISNAGTINVGERRHLVRLRTGGPNDVFDWDAARRQRIGDQRAMTSPWNGFGAHDRD
jgi:hypothetical protein